MTKTMVRWNKRILKNHCNFFSTLGHEPCDGSLPSTKFVTETSQTKSLSCSSDELTTLKTAPPPASHSSATNTTQTQATANTARQAHSVTLTSAQNMLPTSSCYPTHFKQG